MGNSPPTSAPTSDAQHNIEEASGAASSVDGKILETAECNAAENTTSTMEPKSPASIPTSSSSEKIPISPSKSPNHNVNTCSTSASATVDTIAAAANAVLSSCAGGEIVLSKPSCSVVASSPTSNSSSSSQPARVPPHRASRGRPSKHGRGVLQRSERYSRANSESKAATNAIKPASSLPDITNVASAQTPERVYPYIVPTTSVPLSISGENPPPKPFVAIGKPEVVHVVHVKNPSSFYVHRDQDKNILDDLQKFLDMCPERDCPPLSMVTIGDMYICKFLVDDKWYRVVVKDCTAMLNPPESRDAIVDVFYLDYGNNDRVPLSRLRPLPPQLVDVPPYALHCSIFDLHPRDGNGWPDEAHRTFCKMVNGVRVHMNVMSFEDDTYHIDLCAIPGVKHCNFPVSVRDAMVFMDLAYLEDESRLNIRQASSRFDSEYLKEEPLNKGDNFPVVLSHIDNLSQFYVQRRGTHAEYLVKLLDEMSKYYKDNRDDMIYDPGVGMPCAAQFSLDKSWYRARVLSIPRKSWVEILYVDYGNKEEIAYTSIRKLPDKFMRIAPQAIECSLADVMPVKGNKWSKSATTFFLKVTKDKELRLLVDDSKPCIKVILYEEKDTVDVCLNALLVKEGHALSIGVGASLVEYFKVEAALPAEPSCGSATSFETVMPTRKRVKKTRRVDPGGVGLLESNELLPAEQPRKSSKTSKASKGSSIDEETCCGPPLSMAVTIVVITSPGCLYVSPCTLEEDIANLILDMQNFYSGMSSTKSQWKNGDRCAVKSVKDKKWYRAVIVEMVDSSVKVFYKDTALTETVPVRNLRILHDSFANIHDGTFRCHMVGIQAAGGQKWSSVSCEILSELVHTKYTELFITKKGDIEDNSLPIELWARDIVSPGPLEPNRVEWISLNQILVDRGMAIPTSMPETLEILQTGLPLSTEEFGHTPVNSDFNVQELDNKSSESCDETSEEDDGRQELILCPENPRRQWLPATPLKKHCFVGLTTNVDSKGLIYLHNVEDNGTLVVIKDAITKFVGDSIPKPQDMYWFEGQMCLVQFYADQCWYRGKIKEMKENNKYEVFFIDYGNTELCEVEMLRKDVIMTHIPILSHAFELDEIQPANCDGKWNIEHLDFLHMTLDGKKCVVTVKSSLGDEVPKISLTLPGDIDVAQLLVSMHYAIYSTNVINCDTVSEGDSEASVIIENEEVVDLNNSVMEKESMDVNIKAIQKMVDNDSLGCEVENKIASEGKSCRNVCNETSRNFSASEDQNKANVNTCEQECKTSDSGELVNGVCKRTNEICVNSVINKEESETEVSDNEEHVALVADGVKSQENLGEEIHDIDCDVLKVCGDSDEMKEHIRNIEDPVNEVNILKEDESKSDTTSTEFFSSVLEETQECYVKEQVFETKLCITESLEEQDENNKCTLSPTSQDSKPRLQFIEEQAQNDKTENSQTKSLLYKRLDLGNCDVLAVQVTILLDSLTEIVMTPERGKNEEIICRDDFDLMTLQIQNEAASQPPIERPDIGQPCCAQYFEDEQYYRATIVEIKEDCTKVKVEFVDYGNVEWIDIQRVHHIKPEWMELPVQGIKCRLWNLKIAEDCEERTLLRSLSKLIFNQSLTAKIKQRNPLAVELYKCNSKSLVYQPLLDTGLLIEIMEEKSDENEKKLLNN